jgi:pyridoxamine 5'-phosphate oxidase
MNAAGHDAAHEPLALLGRWLADAREAEPLAAQSVAFVTVGADARATARTVSLKRLEASALVFSSALWTRKARELARNPHVALLFHWPALGRQVHVAGDAVIAERALAERLFAERDVSRQLQSIVSRQGEPIDDLQSLRARHAHLLEAMEAPPACPEDWGAIRVRPQAIEFWSEAADRMHDRLMYEREGEDWSLTRLSP